MNLPDLSRLSGLVAVGKTFLSTHRPEILLGTSIVSTVGAAVAAAMGGYKSRGMVDNARYAKVSSPEGPFDTFLDYKLEVDEKTPDLTFREKAELTWMNYLPAAGLTAGALGSTTALHLVHVKEKKALATAALAAVDEVKKEFRKYEEEESIGVVSHEEKQKILSERAEKTPIGTEHNSHIQYSDGFLEELYLVRDDKTGRDIWSSENRIQEAVNNVNKWIASHGDCELNTFYSAAGFNHTPDGDDWGWSGDFVELKWDLIQRDDGRPVRRFKFRTQPTQGYDRACK